jgi:hypothetical protein
MGLAILFGIVAVANVLKANTFRKELEDWCKKEN